MNFGAAFVLALFLIAPFAGALLVCAPKWAMRSPFPERLGQLIVRVCGGWGTFWTKERRYLYPIRLLWAVPFFILALFILAGTAWYKAWFAAIEAKCPYTAPHETAERRAWETFSFYDHALSAFITLFTVA